MQGVAGLTLISLLYNGKEEQVSFFFEKFFCIVIKSNSYREK